MKIKSLVCTFAVNLFLVTLLSEGLTPVTRAQNPAQTQAQVGQVSPEQIQFVAPEGSRQFRVQIYTSVGDLVFDSGETDLQAIYWNQRDQGGNPVADGAYSARLSVVNAEGSARVRIEQILLGQSKETALQAVKQNESMAAKVITTATSVAAGSGTPNQIVKWSDDGTGLVDSALSEVNGNVGLGTTPTARLEINGAQPPALRDVPGNDRGANGINAPPLLVLSGGKGGNSAGPNTTAGAGADISIVAGNGGDTPAPNVGRSSPGRGGDITLQPGSPGQGDQGLTRSGKLLLAPSGGDVLIGSAISAPSAGGNLSIGTTEQKGRLTVAGQIALVDDVSGNGIRFSDGTIQTTASTASAPLIIAPGSIGSSQLAVASISTANIRPGQVTLSVNGATDNVLIKSGSSTIGVNTTGNVVTISTLGLLTSVPHDNTLSGNPSSGSPLGVAVPLMLTSSAPGSILSVTNSGTGAAISGTGAINTTTEFTIQGKAVVRAPGQQNTFVGLGAGESTPSCSPDFIYLNGVCVPITTDCATCPNGYTCVSGVCVLAPSRRNAFFGTNAGTANMGNDNAFFGNQAGTGNTVGNENTFLGSASGQGNEWGSRNTFLGSHAGSQNKIGFYNVFIGSQAGRLDTGNGNTYIGDDAGASSQSGDNNTAIGFRTSVGDGLSNATAIGAKARVTQSDSLVLGSTTGGGAKVGIGTTAPKAKLHVEGGDVFVGTPGQGIILKSPDGTKCAKLTINDKQGKLETQTVTCPD